MKYTNKVSPNSIFTPSTKVYISIIISIKGLRRCLAPLRRLSVTTGRPAHSWWGALAGDYHWNMDYTTNIKRMNKIKIIKIAGGEREPWGDRRLASPSSGWHQNHLECWSLLAWSASSSSFNSNSLWLYIQGQSMVCAISCMDILQDWASYQVPVITIFVMNIFIALQWCWWKWSSW